MVKIIVLEIKQCYGLGVLNNSLKRGADKGGVTGDEQRRLQKR